MGELHYQCAALAFQWRITELHELLIQRIHIVARSFWTWIFVLLLTGIAGCNLAPISDGEALKRTEIRATELEVNVKQTLLAQQQVNRAREQTAQANILSTQQANPEPPKMTSPPEPTETVLAAPPEQPPAPILSPAPPTPEPFNEDNFLKWAKTAKILLYEDMTARLDTIRYIKTTLDQMGLASKNDGSAYGWLLKDLENGPEEGGQWDLIIIAAEDKNGIKANFFESTIQAIDQGTSVILEVYYLDGTYQSSASELLKRCGVEFENNWIRIPPSRAAMFPLSPDNPILQKPNSGLGFSATTEFWWDPNGIIDYDIGDLMKLAPDSKATILIGTTADSPSFHGTSTVCLDGKLILQTFSSHILTFDTMTPLWENYIYNALRTRYINLN